MKRLQLRGKTYGEWYVHHPDPEHPNRWMCECTCGTRKSVLTNNLRMGLSKSCGCRHRYRTHGLSQTKQYRIWLRIRKDETVPEWASFMNFYNDVELNPYGGYVFSRPDPTKPWGPDNSKWMTFTELAYRRGKFPRQKINHDIANQIRIDRKGGMGLHKLGDKYGLHFTTISKIINNHRWKGHHDSDTESQ